ncbi:hypothetical protein Pint_24116 [Pistacia integerrima]|uniref:Uncharacterized protein n=1 Tax=Pistacia integerrima TaxID=434235 RepID=A0ACC0YH41_9ROSI|nr:hypothetical protein Pint_24116 [Pistacia integerrima]
MASLSLCCVGIPSRHPSSLSLNLSPKFYPFTFNFRFKNTVGLQIRQRSFSPFASNSNPSGGDSLQQKPDETKTTDAGQGPPFLTILAGLLVFLFICWMVGSLVLWLVGLIF